MTANSELRSACRARLVDADQHQFAPECISLFRVSLGCEAAAGLGCGVKAKPALEALARRPDIKQAWLNRNGTIVAVLWDECIDLKVRSERVRSILAAQALAARELTGTARERALTEFAAGAGWYQGDAVDRLSEEEAAIIAARVVRRVTARVSLFNDKTEMLLAAIVKVCRHELIDRPLSGARLRRQRIANEILKAGREHLDGAALRALQEGVALGHRPVKGEK